MVDIDISLIERIYDLAADPSGWTSVLDTLSERFSAVCAVLETAVGVGNGGQATEVMVGGGGFDFSRWSEQFKAFAREDPFSRHMLRSLDGDTSRWATALAVTPEEDIRRSRFWHEHFAAMGFGDVAGLIMHEPDRGAWPVLSLIRPREAGVWSEDEVARLQALAPHLRFAARLRYRTAVDVSPAPEYLQTIAAMPTGCVLLRADGGVLFVNPVAEVAFRAQCGIGVRNGRLSSDDPYVHTRIQRSVSMACGSTRMDRRGSEVIVASHDGSRTLLMLAPVGETNPLLGAVSEVRAAAYVLRSAAPSPAVSAERRLIQMFGLTQAQAEVARDLMLGCSPEDIAEVRGRSVHTVRAQVKAVLDRAGLRRSGELQAMQWILNDV